MKSLINLDKHDILCINETKFGESFPDCQLKSTDCKFSLFYGERNSKEGGKMVFVKENLTVKRLQSLVIRNSKTICLEP